MSDLSVFLLGGLIGSILTLATIYVVWGFIKKRNAQIEAKKNIKEKKEKEQVSFENKFFKAIIPLCMEDVELFSDEADIYIRIAERYPLLKKEIASLAPKKDQVEIILESILEARKEKEALVDSEKYEECCCPWEKEREKLKQLVLEAPFLKPLFEAKSAEWHAL
jgi:hypothetical protein